MTSEQPARPPVWPIVMGAILLILVAIGLINVLGWVFRTATTLVLIGLAIVAIWFFVRRR